MKILASLLLTLLSIQTVQANDFAAFKELFDRGNAPTSIDEVEAFLAYETQCLGMNRNDATSSEIFVVQTVVVRSSRGPAFPAVTKKAILIGKAENATLLNLNYQQTLNASHLALNTTRNITSESCDYYEDIGTLCSSTSTREDNVKVKIKMNGAYLVYFNEALQTYGYCW